MKPIRITIIGLSVDLGLLGHTNCHPNHSFRLWLTLFRIIPATMLWMLATVFIKCALFMPPKQRRQLQRHMSHRVFSFLLSKENFHDHEDGFINRLEEHFNRPILVINQSIIGQSLRMVAKHPSRIPSEQDIFFLHLGAMDYINNVPCNQMRQDLRLVLAEIGRKNPQAFVAYLGVPDLVTVLSTPMNRQKALPIPFAPTVGDLHRLEGFHKFLGLTADSGAEKKEQAQRLLNVYVKVFNHELNRAKSKNIIRDFEYFDGRAVPVFAPEDRSKYFALDGMHMTGEGVLKTVNSVWAQFQRRLEFTQNSSSQQILDRDFNASQSLIHSPSLTGVEARSEG